ncbi:nitrate reductase [NADPH] [Cladophialophora psammophila CBS 110553]|uniref:Nitrate reductase n=1 Tax=Cladophialophora psammophila CBS 110553 TaxID=1182543 RepID=W9VCW2_9EURO|nr:nitrate reductase [NADPH] [Cladophialophora psammophila CBS 110553]EXJ53318.1 nitrate reductase [NADPH] [Cladophialophora psammophila CBS 110553]
MEGPKTNNQDIPEKIEALHSQPAKDVLPPSPPPTDGSVSDLDVEKVEIPLPPPSVSPSQVLDVDLKTPDSHIPRDPRLIRLTGVHPFNVEAPLTELFNGGFLTSPELFYVRNHGAVPQVKDEEIIDWQFTVEGLVDEPMTISLKQLMTQYEQVTYPITLVCAGNRRKEQNMVRKSKGFSWGAAGLSTALFTGVVMSDVIKRAKPKRKAKYVCMEGADKLPNGFYGTSVKLNWAMDPNRGFMLAYKMNGEVLRPDHGKPLRAVIPGQIGGRSVKWLKKLIVTDAPSDNWYHIYDNRVLPTMVSPEESASNPKWWTDERYAIYDLSPNSAICYPQHEEQLCLTDAPRTYRARGYAYSGGGRRVTRVEISLDKGKTWRLAEIDYVEDRYRQVERDLFGGRLDMAWRETCFCWCFWSINLPTEELARAKDILVRAMDESMNVQPRDMYWSVLGMMNNLWFRVTITLEGDYLRFEHPTQPALIPGGWMERVKKAGGNLANGFWGEKLEGEEAVVPSEEQAAKEISMVKEGLKNAITIDELRKHDTEQQPWFVVNGEVYDGTAFLKEHPGGAQSIVSAAGLDSTEEFLAIHSETAKAMMPKYHIGSLDEAAKTALTAGETETDQSANPPETFLNPKAWKKAILHGKRIVSWDTRVFTYKLEHPEQRLGLAVGQHLMVRLRDPATREAIIRSYTPISEINDQGFMEMLVKVYFANANNKGGKMSQAMDTLPIGHFIEMKGPIGKFEYVGNGKCLVSGNERLARSFVMICGGSGITPIYQVFRAVVRDPNDKTQCIIFDGNRLFEDILCREELDALLVGNEHRCRVLHTLTKAPEDWTGLRGRITGQLVQDHYTRTDDTLILICGPASMEQTMHKVLLEQGWGEDQLVFF